MSQYEITVVIPAYNCAKTLRRALDSVASQSYPVREIIIIDDCSKDDTLEVAQNFQREHSSKRTKIIVSRNDKNSGPSFSRNKGILLSSAPWIAFLDSDDWWLPEKLEIQLNALEESGSSLIGTGISIVDPMEVKHLSFNYKMLQEKDFYWRNWMVTSSVVMKKHPDLKFDEKMKFSEDYDLWMRSSRLFKVCYVDAPLVVMGKPLFGFSGLSSKLWSMERGELKVLSSIPGLGTRYLAYTLSILKFFRRLLLTKVKSF